MRKNTRLPRLHNFECLHSRAGEPGNEATTEVHNVSLRQRLHLEMIRCLQVESHCCCQAQHRRGMCGVCDVCGCVRERDVTCEGCMKGGHEERGI